MKNEIDILKQLNHVPLILPLLTMIARYARDLDDNKLLPILQSLDQNLVYQIKNDHYRLRFYRSKSKIETWIGIEGPFLNNGFHTTVCDLKFTKLLSNLRYGLQDTSENGYKAATYFFAQITKLFYQAHDS